MSTSADLLSYTGSLTVEDRQQQRATSINVSSGLRL